MTSVYRHFNGAGDLLYIGISRNVSWRLMAHERNAGWWRDVRTVTISEPYPTRAEALQAEAAAIEAERPRFNQQHHPDPVTPPIASGKEGKGLMRRLVAARRDHPDDKDSFATRVAESMAEFKRIRGSSVPAERQDDTNSARPPSTHPKP